MSGRPVEVLGPFRAEQVPAGPLRSWHGCQVAAQRVDAPDDPRPSPPWVLSRIRDGADGRRLTWLAAEGADAVAGGLTALLFDDENRHLAMAETLLVHPDRRRRGIGTALLRTAAVALREAGRATLLLWGRADGPAPAFARSVGAREVETLERYVLRLDRVDRGAVDAAAVARPGYTPVRWVDRCPDALVGSYAAVLAGMNDAPTGGVDWRPVRPDPDRVRRQEAAHRGQGLRRYVVAARHDATGDLAGVTEVGVHPDHPWAEQGDTAVLPGHRGHGLGLWMKADLVRWLAAEQPHVTGYETFTALDNPYMRAVNTRLGHRPDGRWPQWQLTLR